MWNGASVRTGQWLVTWGPIDGPQKTINTPYNIIQLQPLDAGVTYTAVVRTVNATGHASIPSDSIEFQSNSSRVDTLRAQMGTTGFFDDFNSVAGPPDERNWRTSYVYCDDPAYNALFINHQKHVHNVVATWEMSPQSPALRDIYVDAIRNDDKRMLNALAESKKVCDKARGHVVARTTRVFDFTGRTGTIVFDFDGAFGSNYWFLDFVEPGTGDRFTSLHQAGDKFQFFYEPVNRNDSGVIQNTPRRIGITLVRNVRRKFVMQVSQDRVAVFLDGKLLLHSDWALTGRTPLRKTKAFLMFRQTTRATRQDQNLPFLTVHWDNFGFDGIAAPPTVTHTYNVTVRSSAYINVGLGRWENNKMNVTILDSLSGALPRARLHYGYSGSVPSDFNLQHIYINGWKLPLMVDRTIDGQGVFTEFDTNILAAGTNRIQWWLPRQEMRVGNVRLEVDFPLAAEPAYTQPKGWFGTPSAEYGFHAIREKVGLSAVVRSVGPYGSGQMGDGGPPFLFGPYDAPQGANLEFNSSYTISYSINCGIQLISTGRCHGAKNVTLYMRRLNSGDAPTVLDQHVFPGPDDGLPDYGVISWGTTFRLNTMTMMNGTTYELWVEAFDALDTPAIPEYFDGSHYTGEFFPMYIYHVNKPPPEDPPSPLAAIDAPPTVEPPPLVGEAAASGELTSVNSPVFSNSTDLNSTVPSRRARRDLHPVGIAAALAAAAELAGSPELQPAARLRVSRMRLSPNEVDLMQQLHRDQAFVPTAGGHARGTPRVLHVHPEVSAVEAAFRKEQAEDEEMERRGEMSRRQRLTMMGVGTIMG
ncbi:hypothetical protein DFJ74DRAFT_684957 [Hyaloraphidium curvatum]|nr:hypothetical protein DFJ74DRAFT_684957 [Hyaloraphidium curvatum]